MSAGDYEAILVFCCSEILASKLGYPNLEESLPDFVIDDPYKLAMIALEAIEDIHNRKSITSEWLEHDEDDWLVEIGNLRERLNKVIGDREV